MTASFGARPSGMLIAKRAYASAVTAFKIMPSLAVSALIIGALLGGITFWMPYLAPWARPTTAHTAIVTSLFYLPARIAGSLLWAALAAPVAVAMHRFILLGETTHGFWSFAPRRTKLFFLWAFSLQLIYAAVNFVLSLLSGIVGLYFVMSLIVTVGLVVVSTHMVLVFPAVAIDVPSGSTGNRAETSWQQMDGHAWLFIRATIVAFIPLVIFYWVFWIFMGGLHASMHGAQSIDQTRIIVLGVISGLVDIFGIALAAALASWLYAWVGENKPA